MTITWLPFRGGLKANVDGSSMPNLSDRGGVVRSSEGHVNLAFSSYYSSETNNVAKMRAIWDLLQICEASNVTVAVVESDSLNVVRMLKGETTIQWKCSKWCRMIQRHSSFYSVVFHIVIVKVMLLRIS